MDGSATFQNSPRLATARKEGRVGDEKDSHLCLTRCGAEEVERADNSRGELFTPTEDDRVGRLFGRGVGTESWYEEQVLVCCAQTSNRCCTNQHSWRIGRLPDEKGLYHNTNSDKGRCKCLLGSSWTRCEQILGREATWAACSTDSNARLSAWAGQGLQYLVTMIKQTNLLHMTLCWFLYFGNNFSHILKLRLFLILKYELGPLSECPTHCAMHVEVKQGRNIAEIQQQ